VAIHVNIGEAKTRLSQLIAAALRGEEVVVDNDGRPQVRLVAVPEATDAERERMIAKRRAAVGKWAKDFENWEDINPEWVRAQREYSEERRKLYGDDLR
jgi:antitoxin (DNA-binding transcriptional repressor) of toxin-antitoxin stability system